MLKPLLNDSSQLDPSLWAPRDMVYVCGMGVRVCALNQLDRTTHGQRATYERMKSIAISDWLSGSAPWLPSHNLGAPTASSCAMLTLL